MVEDTCTSLVNMAFVCLFVTYLLICSRWNEGCVYIFFRFLKDFMKPFNASTNLFLGKLLSKANGKTEVTLAEHFNRVTLDVIAKVCYILNSLA